MVSDAAVAWQVERLVRGPTFRRLVRPCTVGDGIVRLDAAQRARYAALHDEAAANGRCSAFVPASGAATRMLAGLADQKDVLAHARDLALWGSLGLPDDAAPEAIAAAILDRWSGVPKGLVPFHRAAEGVRTPFVEHLVEGTALVRDRLGTVRLHFTVGDDHEMAFREAVARARPHLEARLGARLEVTFSTQDPATDTVALADGELARDLDGHLVTRPGGHGALLGNLQRSGGDLVLVKNIDNIVPDARRDEVVAWRRALGGMLVDLLREPAQGPVRVCAMVRNDGQPGGGPFFVEGQPGPQIVESAEVDLADPGQKAIWNAATHFNPVDLAVSLRDPAGAPWDLARFADPEAVIVTRKTQGGRALVVLEHPGLWNGGMARWSTVFVEVPREVFQPVKTLGDLLGPGHATP